MKAKYTVVQIMLCVTKIMCPLSISPNLGVTQLPCNCAIFFPVKGEFDDQWIVDRTGLSPQRDDIVMVTKYAKRRDDLDS